MTKLVSPVPFFPDGRGGSLDGGYIWVGASGTDPEVVANQINLFWDKALTVPATQPLRTLGGFVVEGFNLGLVYFAEPDFSVTVRDADSNLVTFISSAFDLGGTSYQPLATSLTVIAALALGATGESLLTAPDAATARGDLSLGTISTFDEATAAQFRANTSGKALSTDKVWGAAVTVALSPGASVVVDLSTGFNFSLAMGGNYTLADPTNGKDGQSGKIEIMQDGTGSRTLAYGANWIFAGGTDPILSTAAGARDVLFYEVLSDGKIMGSLVKALA